MSIFMQNTNFGPRAQEIQWMNIIVTSHGMICGCEKPWNHLQDILKNQQLRCHFIGETSTQDVATYTGDDDGDVLDAGLLEELFKEDTEDAAG